MTEKKKLTLYILGDERIIAVPSGDVLSDSEVKEALYNIREWSMGKINYLVTYPDADIVDLRIPQKEQIEKLIAEALESKEKTPLYDYLRSIYQAPHEKDSEVVGDKTVHIREVELKPRLVFPVPFPNLPPLRIENVVIPDDMKRLFEDADD